MSPPPRAADRADSRASPAKRSGRKPQAASRASARSARRSSPSPQAGPAPFTVFLDRDGVFNRHPRFVVMRARGFRWLPGALEAFARLDRPHIRTCLATNQPFLGMWTLGLRLPAVNRAFLATVREAGGRMDRIEASLAPPFIGFLAPLLPGRLRHSLRRRKPSPGMLEDGGRALGADKARAVMVGDKVKDAQAAAAYGIPSILVATTHTEATLRKRLARRGVAVHAIVPGLPEAVDEILAMAR